MAYNREYEEVRKQKEERIAYNKEYEEVRNQKEGRREYKRTKDAERYMDEPRKEYLKKKSSEQYQKKLISTFTTDTGFDLICCCCLQFKSAYACKNIDVLSANQQKEYTIKTCKLLENRKTGLNVCTSCLKDINNKKNPKKSHKNSFKFANFPNSFIQKLKRKCRSETNFLSEYFKEDNEAFTRKALQLNKLESFLLKTVIPFIRIAHCPRGSYFKVLGDLILISADVSESMEKICPWSNPLFLFHLNEN